MRVDCQTFPLLWRHRHVDVCGKLESAMSAPWKKMPGVKKGLALETTVAVIAQATGPPSNKKVFTAGRFRRWCFLKPACRGLSCLLPFLANPFAKE